MRVASAMIESRTLPSKPGISVNDVPARHVSTQISSRGSAATSRSLSKIVSIPKKKIASIVVMIMTITPVMTVSRRVGQTTFLVSAWTCRMNSNGVVFATLLSSLFKTHEIEAWSRCPGPKEPAPSILDFGLTAQIAPDAPGKQETRPFGLPARRRSGAGQLRRSLIACGSRRIRRQFSNFAMVTRGGARG